MPPPNLPPSHHPLPRLPYVRTLDGFDFSFQPTVKRAKIDALHELGFLERRENVVFLGPPCHYGGRERAQDLLRHSHRPGRLPLEEAKAVGRLKTLTHPPLLVVDEIGYLPVTQSGAVLFFQLINRRYGARLDRTHIEQGLRGVGPPPEPRPHTRPWPSCVGRRSHDSPSRLTPSSAIVRAPARDLWGSRGQSPSSALELPRFHGRLVSVVDGV